jgi:predicted NBD/HSP70 family sugar kinase
VEELRARNTGLVLTSLRHDGPTTRTELARRTGLAKATVGTIVAALGDHQLVAESGPVTSGRGRPGRPIALTGHGVVGLGIEVNVDYVTAVTMDLSGAVRHEQTVAVGSADPLEVLRTLVEDSAGRAQAAGARVAGLTTAVPGLVAADAATVRWAPNLHWRDLDLAAVLRDVVGDDVPCTVDNDANCAALAEAHHGAARRTGSALYLTGTVGVGAGIVVDGRLLRGAAGFAGEVGHLPLGDIETSCACGRHGCWETVVGLHALLEAVAMEPVGTPWQCARAVAECAADGDAVVIEGIDRVGDRLGRGLASLAAMIDPAVVVLGGYFVPLAEWLVPAAERRLGEDLSFADLQLPQIRLSDLDLRAAAIGAAEQSLADVLGGRVLPI